MPSVPGQAQAGFVFGQYRFRFRQRFSVKSVEAPHNLPGLLQHGQLVFAHGHRVRLKRRNVRRLRNGIRQKAHGQGQLEVFLLDLRLYRRIAFQPCQRDEVHIIKRQLGQFRHVGLYENGGFFWIDAAGKIIQRNLGDVGAYLFGGVEIIRQRLRVRDHNINFFKFSAVLQLHPTLQRADVMPDMQFSRRAVARQNDIFHKKGPSFFSFWI